MLGGTKETLHAIVYIKRLLHQSSADALGVGARAALIQSLLCMQGHVAALEVACPGMLNTAESSLPHVTGASGVYPPHPDSTGNVSSLGVADPDALSSSCMTALPDPGLSPTAPSISQPDSDNEDSGDSVCPCVSIVLRYTPLRLDSTAIQWTCKHPS